MKRSNAQAALFLLCAFLVLCSYARADCTPVCASSADCDDANPLTTDACMGAGECGAYCSHSECSAVCKSDAECDDGIAATTDVCAGKGGCNAGCRNLRGCGNGACEAATGETPCTCAQDCGICSGALPGACMEKVCIGSECAAAIASACCGNARCEPGENYVNCGADCKAAEISAEILGDGNGTYARGGKIEISVSVYSGEFGVSAADVNAKGFFGEVGLYNDGMHGDGTANDNVYGNGIVVPDDGEYGSYAVAVDAEFEGARAHAERTYEIKPDFYITVSADRKNYTKGDAVKISGTVFKGGKGFATELELKIGSAGFVVWRALTNSGTDGSFEAEYRGTDTCPEGMLRITASGLGKEGGRYPESAEAEIFMFPADVESFLNIEITGKAGGDYAEGEQIEFTADVSDENGGAVDGAKVTLACSGGGTAEMGEVAGGRYKFSETAESAGGIWGECQVIAVKNENETRQEGRVAVEIEIAGCGTGQGCKDAAPAAENVADAKKAEPSAQQVFAFAAVSAVCIAAYLALGVFVKGSRNAELKSRGERAAELEEKIKEAQARYFKGAMKADEYYMLVGKYKAELGKERGR